MQLELPYKQWGQVVTITSCIPPAAGVVSTALFNKGSFRFPFMVSTYFMQLLLGASPLQGALSSIYAATGGPLETALMNTHS